LPITGTVGDGASYINLAWARRLNTTVAWEFDNDAMKIAQQTCDQSYQSSVDENGKKISSGSGCQIDQSKYLVLKKYDNFTEQGYTSIVMKVDDTKNLKTVSEEISKLGYGATTAQSMIDQINKIILMIGAVLAVIGGISLFVAGIGIVNTMIMATYERTKEIGVMRACGATRAMIRRLFTFEAAALGFWGGIFGLFIAFALGQVAKILVSKFGASLGNIPVENIGEIPFFLVVGVIAFTTIIGMLAGLSPAIRAARMDPVEALRSE